MARCFAYSLHRTEPPPESLRSVRRPVRPARVGLPTSNERLVVDARARPQKRAERTFTGALVPGHLGKFRQFNLSRSAHVEEYASSFVRATVQAPDSDLLPERQARCCMKRRAERDASTLERSGREAMRRTDSWPPVLPSPSWVTMSRCRENDSHVRLAHDSSAVLRGSKRRKREGRRQRLMTDPYPVNAVDDQGPGPATRRSRSGVRSDDEVVAMP